MEESIRCLDTVVMGFESATICLRVRWHTSPGLLNIWASQQRRRKRKALDGESESTAPKGSRSCQIRRVRWTVLRI
jgi:hypothetical protein